MRLIPDAGERLKEIKKLYKSAFPQNERAPFRLFLKQQKQGALEVLSIEDEAFLGLAITFFYRDMVLLEYFAVDPAARSKGVGGQALGLIKKRYPGKRLFLTIEAVKEGAPDYELRARRKAFYQRNGLVAPGISLVMFGVEMELMTDGSEVSFAEYCEIYEHIVGKWLMRILKIRQVQ